VVLTAAFFLYPLAGTVWTSLFRQPLYGPGVFAGAANYVAAFRDTQFWTSVLFTLAFTAVTLVIGTVFSFALALLVSQQRRGVGLFRTAFFIPVTVGFAASGFLWFYMLDGRVGVLNDILMRLGLTHQPIEWLSDPRTSFWAIALMTIWKSAGFAMVIFIIGIQAIPKELFEALHVDGAGRWNTLRYLTIPMLRYNVALVVILGIVTGMLSFDQFFTMTKGGPNGSTMTAVYSIYANAFEYQKLGYGSALSVILLGALAIVSAVQLLVFRRRS
jgi:multiple sugar transport system permease protein